MKIEIRYQNFDNTADDYGRYFLWNTDADERETVATFETEQDAADYRVKHECGLNREETLRARASRAAGLMFDSPEADKCHNPPDGNDYDWSQYYPVCDAYGILTGGICGSDDDGYANVFDLAQVPLDELNDGQRYKAEHYGYASPFPA
jgi:hypothetical protein